MVSTGDAVSFPLPDRFFPKVSLSDTEIAQHRASAREVVTKTLEHEIEFRTTHEQKLDKRLWKKFRSKDRLRVYKRRSASTTTTSRRPTTAAAPMVLAVGQIEGRVDDLLYGIHHKTTEEMRVTTSFMNARHVDAAVLHTIDSSSTDDPFRYLGIRWRIAETPGGKLVSNRDVCVLECIGKQDDLTGTSYGVHMIKSIDAPWFPPLPGIIRARMMLCCIYRQRDATTVDCYMKAVFEVGGGALGMIAYETAADSLFSVTKAIDCAYAKKLTLQLVMQQQQLETFTHSTGSASSGPVKRDGRDPLGKRNAMDDDDACSVCLKPRSRFGPKWTHCRLCHELACSKCIVKKTVFARPTNMTVACCKLCVIASRDLEGDPRAPLPVVTSLTPTAVH